MDKESFTIDFGNKFINWLMTLWMGLGILVMLVGGILVFILSMWGFMWVVARVFNLD